ncbi:MAG: hypothetical protein A3J58_03230 [Candidatus Sungbacteria bacterium RIFCSPHIGHO2_02_FULL_52_23]|uniref:Uncharacterized protein n=1 Tax=Candidatus Sungbacteria bacterium RIFCSPHIGHO2_02_FULL_52_23 TaxID=1802274 RepID=A0A1G2KVN4_9BACT|nr:MAG: hypothetical protein A3J58_03230 [Candidatus Sungbacteria bacterium RIFCSPHIGHO2_02_FULL_52_23]
MYMQDLNFWFFTLSAIPQTLGALVALVVAFVIYRIGEIDRLLGRDIPRMKRCLLAATDATIAELNEQSSREILRDLQKFLATMDPERSELGLELPRHAELVEVFDRMTDEEYGIVSSNSREIYLYLQEKANKIEVSLNSRALILEYLKVSVILSLFTIVASLGIMPQSSFFLPQTRGFIVACVLFLTVVSAAYTGYSVFVTVNPRGYLQKKTHRKRRKISS